MDFLTKFIGDILSSPATQQALQNALIVLAGWIGLKIKGFVDAQTKKLQEEAKVAKEAGEIAKFNATEQIALHLLEVGVNAAEETTVKKIKEESADGTLTKAEGIEIKNEVISNTLKQLGAEKQNILQAVLTDVKAHFGDVIHANLNKLKLLAPGK